ncbi:MAG: hypothetical protein IJU20_06255 [Clostridia bacterium]|nr:hypothetical protein [Clostridia bacterium]
MLKNKFAYAKKGYFAISSVSENAPQKGALLFCNWPSVIKNAEFAMIILH